MTPDSENTARLVRIETMVSEMHERDRDHETRLRSLERWRWILAGVALAATGSGVGSIVASLTTTAVH